MDSHVKLIDWSYEVCDETTYDPYLLKTRITKLDTLNGVTSITVNFSDYCHSEFKPIVEFKNNQLMLYPYKKNKEGRISCKCCFSIKYIIEGINTPQTEILFNDEKIVLTDEYYKVYKPSYQIYKGDTINKLNKYNFKEGLWMYFHENGEVSEIIEYPKSSLFFVPVANGYKEFGENGNLLSHFKYDTIISWYENGEIEYQRFEYKHLDTTFLAYTHYYENGQVNQRYLKRTFPKGIEAVESNDEKNILKTDFLFNEAYYQNGQIKFKHLVDTIINYFEDGKIKSIDHNNGSMEYNETGKLVKRSYNWEGPEIDGWQNMQNSIFVSLFPNGEIQEIHYKRDEISNSNSKSSKSYYWKWDVENMLLQSPYEWNEEYPWKWIDELNLSLKNHQLK